MRTSVNVGLCTCSSDPVPRATPRTKVVLPEPSGPASSTRSPAFKRDPVSSPSASVSAAEAVVTSRKVVVATPRNLGAFENHCALSSEDANGGEPGAANDVLGPDAHELHLFPARQRVLERCSCCYGNVAGLEVAPAARHLRELFHLPSKSVRNIAAAKTELVQALAFVEHRLQSEGSSLSESERGATERTGHRHRPTRLGSASRQRPRGSTSRDRERQDRGPVDRAHVTALDRHTDLRSKRMHASEQPHEVVDLPRPRHRDRRQRPRGACTLRRKVAERERQRAPPGVFGGHPFEVEVDAFDRHVSADDGERARLSQDRGIVAAGLGAEIRLDELEQLELARPTDGRHTSSISRRRRAAASGSGASPIALITQTRCSPSLVSCWTLDSSIPPMANTGTSAPAAFATISTPSGPITFFSVLTGVANA